MSRSKRLN